MFKGVPMPAAFAAGVLVCAAAMADTTLEPRSAEIMPKADESVLIDVTRVGDGYLAAGERGHILHSPDGREWTQVEVPMRAMINRLYFISDATGWAVGHDGSILKTTDGGLSWSLQMHDAEWGKPWYDVYFANDRNGIVIGANSAMKVTTDGGASWEDVQPDFTMHGVNLYAIRELTDGTLMICGEKGMMARSTDGGANWDQLLSPYAGSFFGIVPRGDKGAFVFGLRGTVYQTDDVAAAPVQDSLIWDEFSLHTISDPNRLIEIGWRHFGNRSTESLFGGEATGSRDAILVGVNGAVVRTDGDHMTLVPTPIEATLGDALIEGGDLLAVGVGGVHRVPLK